MSLNRDEITFNDGVCNFRDGARPQEVSDSLSNQLKSAEDATCHGNQIHSFKIALLTNFYNLFQLTSDTTNQLYFTYSVEWKESTTRWAFRSDNYLSRSDERTHWFGILNSLAVIFCMLGML